MTQVGDFLTILLIWHLCYNHVSLHDTSFPVFSVSSLQCCIHMKHVNFIFVTMKITILPILEFFVLEKSLNFKVSKLVEAWSKHRTL